MLTIPPQTLINASRKQNLSEVVDIDLSRNEDSVTSLAVAQSTEASLVAFAGINSSEADQKVGKNEHLRCLKLYYPTRRRPSDVDQKLSNEGDITNGRSTEALGRVSLFTPSTAAKKETYQRVLKLLRPLGGGSGVGAVATGLAPEGEIVLFEYSKAHPKPSSPFGRIKLAKGEEAADLDLIRVEGEGNRLAYCTDYDVYLIKSAFPNESYKPQSLHETPFPDVFASTKLRPKFRSLRFLTPNLLLLLQNRPDRKGADLLLLEIPKFSLPGTVILRKSLHKSIKSATALSVALLPSKSSSWPVQHAVAIAGQDNSITILTIDHPSSPPFPLLSFRKYSFHASVHPLQITSLTFSTFSLPQEASKAPPQYLKLASTSVASTIVVHTIPLSPFPSSSRSSQSPQYVLRSPGRSEAAQVTFSVVISALVIALGAFFLQAFTEIRGGTPEYLGAKGWLNSRVHEYIARPYMFEDLAVTTSPPSSFSQVSNIKMASRSTNDKLGLRKLLSQRRHSTQLVADDVPNSDILIVSSHEDGVSVSADIKSSAQVLNGKIRAKKWEELHEKEREGWKKRLSEAGEWAVEEGEAVLQGIFFSEVAGIVEGIIEGVAG